MTIAPAQPRHAALRVHEHVTRTVLPNGLTLLVRRDASAPVVGIYTHVKAGYFDETDAEVGIAHVLEHMYFKGTPSRGVGAIARETKLAGGWLNAHTIYDHTAYVTVLPSSALERGLDIQFDAFAHSAIDADELARELEVIIQEAKRKRDAPGAVTIESLFALLHDHHRIRRWRIGDPEQLRTFTRAMVHAFYRRWYVPSNTVLSIVGDVHPDAVHDAVLARYGTLPAGTVQRDSGPEEQGDPGLRQQDLTGAIAQAHVAFGWRTPSLAHPDTPALELAATILGSGRASRGYRAVRERELASGVSAFHYTSGNAGVFVVHAETPPATLRAATLATWREVQAARRDGVAPEELVRAQRVLEARWLRRLETMDGQAAYLAAWEAEGGTAMGEAYFEQLQRATPADVQQALQRHLAPEQLSVLVYRNSDTDALPATRDALQGWLQTVAHEPTATAPVLSPVSRLVSPPATPPAAALRRSAASAERVVGDVHVFRTRRDVPVLVRTRAGAPLVNIGIFVRGGAAAEPEALSGVTRLMSLATLKGTRTQSGAEIALAAESLGGSIAVSTGMESLSWSMSVPTPQLEAALSLLASVVQTPVFAAPGIDGERQLAIAEVERLRDDMFRWPVRLAMQAALGSHPYARSVVGTPESLRAIGVADVVAAHQRAVAAGACMIGVVGDVRPAEVADLVAARFPALSWGEDQPPSPIAWPTTMVQQVEELPRQQSAFAMLFRAPSRRDPARFTGRVLSAVASGLGGRFFEQLRDRQSLAYTVAAYPIERRVEGLFLAYIATAPEREDEARAGLLAEFAALRDAPVHDEEIERARRYLIGAHAISQQSGGARLAELVDAWAFGDGLSELAEHDARILAVTPEDVQRYANRYFTEGTRAEGVVRGGGG